MRVLCVNHTGAVSGAERSLLELIGGLVPETVVMLACPAPSPLSVAASRLGISLARIPSTDGSLKLHARETPRAIVTIAWAAALTAVAARRFGADVIHANSIRAGLISVPASRLAGIPCVVHLRDRLPRSAVADASLRLIAAGAQTVVANSAYTGLGLTEVSSRGNLRIVHNPVDLARFAAIRSGGGIRSELGISDDAPLLGLVGQITPWKGQLEAAQTLQRLRDVGCDAHLALVGEAKFISSATRYDNRQYVAELRRTVARAGLTDRVHFLGERVDIPELMRAFDALLVPSWEEPFGRVVLEAMAAGTVVVATSIGGPAEIIEDGVNGILLAPRAPDSWARALSGLARVPDTVSRLTEHARDRARDFALPVHVAAMRSVYADSMGSGGSAVDRR